MDAGTATGSDHRTLDAVYRRKPTKKTKQPKNRLKKPIKVVYISNPMKVQTSASGFMALVQELTGQDADFPDPSKFPPSAVCDGAASTDQLYNTISSGGEDDGATNLIVNSNNSSLVDEVPAEDDILGSFYDDFDDLIFPSPVIGNFSGLLPAPVAAVVYESNAR
ncbi:sigma factor binding protein 2, chloroplastic [Cucumis sativus]|uniref:VQ domain-containing protein n=1 Tax=Cucumis sativus TaxID=3659 RepID=A0A0A0L3J8_CUCSA|nr:sigma factor binding protein 2, chloroplastic [Cucumis sativus]